MINFFYHNVSYRLKGSKKLLAKIERVIRNEKKISGDLNFILCSNEEIIELNRKFLKHNYYTDVIAFSYGGDKILDGDIYISLDTVLLNSINYKVSLRDEIIRVMIHGTLHLCGYEDKEDSERETMRKIEDKWLLKFNRDD